MTTVGIRWAVPPSGVAWSSDPLQMSRGRRRGSRHSLVPGRRRAIPAMWILVLAVLSAVVPGVGVSPYAAAAPSVSAAASSSTGFEYYCFYKRGVFKTGTHVVLADWNRDGQIDECFGIAPDRRIYHVWPASNGWIPMPNNGLADNMADPGWNAINYAGGQQRSVHVLVNGKGTYFSCLDTGYPPWKHWSPWSQTGCVW